MHSGFRSLIDLLRATPFHPQWLMRGQRCATESLRRFATGNVLDIGCSRRWVEAHVSPLCNYIGLDYPPTGLAMYDSRPDVYADACELPFANESMDTVVLFETLEHVARPADAISEIARVLKPGGCLLLTMPFLYPLHDEPFDYTRFTSHGLRKELERAGLSISHIEPSMGSAETAGLIVCLSLGGMTLQSFRTRSLAVLLSPLVILAIPAVNIAFWTIGKLMPSWDAIPAGYHVIAGKIPESD